MIKKFIIAILLMAVSGLALIAYFREPLAIDIDNAYVSGRILRIFAPQSGYIESTSIEKGEYFLSSGAMIRYNQEEVDLEISRLVAQYRLSIDQEIAHCFAFEKALEEHEKLKLERDYTEKRFDRARSMLDGRSLLSLQEVDERTNDLAIANKAIDVSAIEIGRLRALNNLPILSRASVRRVEHLLRESLHQKSLHTMTLLFAGFAYESLMYPGKFVSEGELLAIVVPKERLMIEANVLESKLSQIQPGQLVDIELDSHRGMILEGYVHDVVPSTAATLSSLPRNNTDSNWIKVSQRVPVIVGFASALPEDLTVALGASVRLSIDLNREPVLRPARSTPAGTNVDKYVDTGQDQFVESIVNDILGTLSDAEKSMCKFRF